MSSVEASSNVVAQEQADPPKPSLRVDQNDASALLDILISRGFFHAAVAPLRSVDVEFPCENEGEPNKTLAKEESMLIETDNKSYVMMDTLQRLVVNDLIQKGRLTIADASNATNVSTSILLQRVVPRIMESPNHELVTVQGASGAVKEIVTGTYIQERTTVLWSELHDSPERGMTLLSEAAQSIYKLPADMTLSIVEKKIASLDEPSDVQILVNGSGSKVLVTDRYLKHLTEQIAEALSLRDDARVDMKVLSKERGWDITWVLRLVKEGSFATLPGEFHGGTYVPTSYTEGKRRLVLESFSTNGFVTSHMCHVLFGILTSQMKEFVARGDESTLVLDNTVVHVDSVVAPLVEAAKDAAESASWLDLQHHIPMEIMEHQTDDARALVDDHVLTETHGMAHVQSLGALFFSHAMIASFQRDHLSSLIQAFAASTATALLASEDQRVVPDLGDDVHVSGKEKRRSRHASKSKQSDTFAIPSVHGSSVPLDDVVQRLLEVHPDLDSADVPRHVLTETCRLSFCTEEFEAQCDEAVRTELERLRQETKTNQSTTVFSLGTFHSVEAAFEDAGCFSTLCFLIQARAKFLSYAIEHLGPDDNSSKTLLERDFLVGCCAEFTSRATQYTLLKNNVDAAIFTFQREKSTGDKQFFHPVDLAARSFDVVHLACDPNKVGQRHDPLALLREELPTASGVALARLWILCGGECYHGGTKTVPSESEKQITRPGDVGAFVAHVREHCLTICGIPFTNLDKKSEKKFLHARRAALVQQLEATTDAVVALELRIMWQYQLAKNMVVSGRLLCGPVLQLLLQERKVPEPVTQLLALVAEKLTANEEVDEELIKRLKDTSSAKE